MNADVLTQVDLVRLTYFKWRYVLEALGFTASEVRQLMFVTWLRRTGRY